MAQKKVRSEIPGNIAADVLFRSHRTCCVCRNSHRPIQIHHIDENPDNSKPENLAVLCFDCHRDTQIRGGFDRKLDAAQVVKYRDDWYLRVEEGRREQVRRLTADSAPPSRVLNYATLKETDDENRFSFEATYPQLSPVDSTDMAETNRRISEFITRISEEFCAEETARAVKKNEWLKQEPNNPQLIWDDLSISHRIGLFNEDLLAVEFVLTSYFAGAFHPNSNTRTLNFQLRPNSALLALHELFEPKSDYLSFLSDYCIKELHESLPDHMKEMYPKNSDTWIQQGAGPRHGNFENFLLVKRGLRIVFDAYHVGSYAEGRREVLIPISAMKGILKQSFARLLL